MGTHTTKLAYFYVGDNRERHLRAVSDVIGMVIEHVEHNQRISAENNYTLAYMTSRQHMKQLMEALSQAQSGLKNLVYSYNDDKTIMAQIDTIIDKIEHFLETYKLINLSDITTAQLAIMGKRN